MFNSRLQFSGKLPLEAHGFGFDLGHHSTQWVASSLDGACPDGNLKGENMALNPENFVDLDRFVDRRTSSVLKRVRGSPGDTQGAGRAWKS